MRVRFRKVKNSEGLKHLSKELQERGINSKILKSFNSRYRQRNNDIVINWGNTHRLGINELSGNAANKLRCLSILREEGIPVPDFTNDVSVALTWLEKGAVCCRTDLYSSGGQDIIIATKPEDMVRAPLYTKYIKKKDEYRVHVFNKEVIDVQRKAKRLNAEITNWQVRNHSNGFVFIRSGVSIPDHVAEMCKQAIIILDITFGAVDLIYNEHHDQWYILEVNTAPGLEGSTIISYANAIQKLMGE